MVSFCVKWFILSFFGLGCWRENLEFGYGMIFSWGLAEILLCSFLEHSFFFVSGSLSLSTWKTWFRLSLMSNFYLVPLYPPFMLVRFRLFIFIVILISGVKYLEALHTVRSLKWILKSCFQIGVSIISFGLGQLCTYQINSMAFSQRGKKKNHCLTVVQC